MRHLLTHTAGIREVLHPDLWGDLCGWYHFFAHPTDPGKLALGAGTEVFVRSGQLMMRYLSPIPALYRGFPLHPDDDTDPYVFRIDFSTFGIEAARVIFSRERGAGTTAVHLDFGPLSFQKQPTIKNPRLWITGALSALAVASAATAVRRRHRSNKGV